MSDAGILVGSHSHLHAYRHGLRCTSLANRDYGRDIDGWIRLLEQILALDPTPVVVGHGAPDARHGAQVLAEQIRWLQDFKAAIAAQDTLPVVEAAMLRTYPDYANASLPSHMG